METILIFIFGIGVGAVVFGYWMRKRKCNMSRQEREKNEKKEMIIKFIKAEKKMNNEQVEKLVNVSDATAERYLDELEKEGRIRQIGKTGKHVYYKIAE